MKRILLMVFRNLLLVPYAWIRLCYVAAHAEKYTKEERYRLLHLSTDMPTVGGEFSLMCMEQKIFLKKTDLSFFPIIRDCMMFWRSLKPVRGRFPW